MQTRKMINNTFNKSASIYATHPEPVYPFDFYGNDVSKWSAFVLIAPQTHQIIRTHTHARALARHMQIAVQHKQQQQQNKYKTNRTFFFDK